MEIEKRGSKINPPAKQESSNDLTKVCPVCAGVTNAKSKICSRCTWSFNDSSPQKHSQPSSREYNAGNIYQPLSSMHLGMVPPSANMGIQEPSTPNFCEEDFEVLPVVVNPKGGIDYYKEPHLTLPDTQVNTPLFKNTKKGAK